MKASELISAVAIGVLIAKVCCGERREPLPPPPPPPPSPKPPCKCVYKRYYDCNR